MEEWVEEEGSKEDKRNVLYPKSSEDMLTCGRSRGNILEFSLSEMSLLALEHKEEQVQC